MFIHDQFTKLMGAIPTPQKGGKALNYIVTEVVRFIMQTNHKEVSLRCDCEPATLAILDSVKKTYRSLGIQSKRKFVRDEPFSDVITWCMHGQCYMRVGSTTDFQ